MSDPIPRRGITHVYSVEQLLEFRAVPSVDKLRRLEKTRQTPLDLGRVGDDATLVEDLGYGGLAVEETKDDPYVVMALAAQATSRLRLTTAIAMAFPRSPTARS